MKNKVIQIFLPDIFVKVIKQCSFIVMLAVCVLLAAEKEAWSITPEELCPTEKYDSVTVQGKYLGWQLPHTPDGTITVRLRDSHVPLYILASETRARSLFGRNYNAFVEVTYDFIQHYSREEELCRRYYVLKAGKLIDEQKETKFYH